MQKRTIKKQNLADFTYSFLFSEKSRRKHKIFLSILFLFLMMSFVSGLDLTCGNGIVSRYSFNTGSGVSVIDVCGRNNGTFVDSPIWTTGINGGGLAFDGVDDVVQIENSTSLNLVDNFTLAIWVKPHNLQLGDIFFSKDNAYRIRFSGVSNSKASAGFYRGGWKTTTTSTSVLGLNNWVFITATYQMNEPESVIIYINGTLEINNSGFVGSGLVDTSLYNLTIGNDGGNNWFDGVVDEMWIINRTLNSSEIMELYNLTIFPCEEDWILNYTECNITNQRVKNYIDVNECGTNVSIPVDYGQVEVCDYCSPSWICSIFNQSCGDTLPQPSIIECLNITDLNYATCCSITGLSSDCDYSGNVTDFNKLCGNISVVLVLPSYPYVDFNTSYEMQLYMYQNGNPVNLTKFKINLTEPSGDSFVFNWTWDSVDERFEKTLIFLEEGDYPFKISAYYPYDNIEEITGTLIVRKPYYITFRIWEVKDTTQTQYKNDFGYILLEFKEPRYYNPTLENYLSPLFFSKAFDTRVFHAPYDNGEATIKLWENDTLYEARFVDGLINFGGTYAPLNMTKGYGTNFYIGEFNFTGTDEYNVYVKEKEIRQYRWLFNWGFMIGLFTIFIVSVGLFFVIPEMPFISFVFGILFTTLLIIGRIAIWFWLSW